MTDIDKLATAYANDYLLEGPEWFAIHEWLCDTKDLKTYEEYEDMADAVHGRLKGATVKLADK